MGQLNAMIPLGVKPVDVGSSLASGYKLANTLMGGSDLTNYEAARLALSQANANRYQSNADRSFSATEAYRKALLDRRDQEGALAKERANKQGVVESIRGKLTRGEQLSPGEKQVYDDAQRLSLFDRILLGDPGQQPSPGGVSQPPQAPLPQQQPTLGQPGPQPQFQPQSRAPSLTPLPKISTAEEARRLPSGTKFVAPDGSVRVVP
jgi:hypothetical protein